MLHNQPPRQYTRTELAPFEARLNAFKVADLQSILSAFKVHKMGKKQELCTRCLDLLRMPQHTETMMKQIREQEAKASRPAPYQMPTMNANSYNAHSMYRPNGGMGGYGGSGYGGMPSLNALGMNMHMQQSHTQAFTARPARNLTPIQLPFYDAVFTLLDPQELPASTGGNKINAQVVLSFNLQPDHHGSLQTRQDVFPRTEVQMRFFNTTGDILNIEQADDFPLNCAVRINESPVTLPNVIPTNKPNVEPKRPSRPVNLTQYVLGQSRDKQHKLRVDWSADKRTWAVAIYLVSRVNSEILRKRVENSPSFDLPYETTQSLIRKRLNGDDDDVAMQSLKISLLCPLSKTRMRVAAKSRDCTHLQCFDLDSYLQMNEKRPTWKCCVCNSSAPYHKLIIDQYFMRMLKELSPTVTDVELLKDGSYKVIAEDDVCDISDDDDGGSSKPKAAAAAGGSAAAAAGSSKNAGGGDDVITLSDDDEVLEAIQIRNAIAASIPPSSTTPDTPRTPISKGPSASSSSSLDNSIIILSDDDSPPRTTTNKTTAASSSSSSSAAPAAAAAARPAAHAPPSSAASAFSRTAPTNLADALNQAGLRPNAPSSLHLGAAGVGPMSAAAIAVTHNTNSIFNWSSTQPQHQQPQQLQQPQSAPPLMNQWGGFPQMQMGGYGGYYQMQQQQQPYGGYPGSWGAAPSNQYAGQNNGVIRRPDDHNR